MIRKAAPPFFDAITGKATKFPNPTAEPAAARIKPNLELNFPLASALKLQYFQRIRIFLLSVLARFYQCP